MGGPGSTRLPLHHNTLNIDFWDLGHFKRKIFHMSRAERCHQSCLVPELEFNEAAYTLEAMEDMFVAPS